MEELIGNEFGFEENVLSNDPHQEELKIHECLSEIKVISVRKLLSLQILNLAQNWSNGENLLKLMRDLKEPKFHSEVDPMICEDPDQLVFYEKKLDEKLPWNFKKQVSFGKEIKASIYALNQTSMDLWGIEHHPEQILRNSDASTGEFTVFDELLLKLLVGVILSLLTDSTVLGSDKTIDLIDTLARSQTVSNKCKKKCMLAKKYLEDFCLVDLAFCITLLESFKDKVYEQYSSTTDEKLTFDEISAKLASESRSAEETAGKLLKLFLVSFWIPASIYEVEMTSLGPTVSRVLLDQTQVSGRQCRCSIVMFKNEELIKPLLALFL